MKKLILLAAFFTGLITVLQAQVCTVDTAGFTPGVYIYPASLPCITQGTVYSGTISVSVPDSVDAHLFDTMVPAGVSYLYIDSMTIDSITGFPAGITPASLPGAGVWMYGGSYGCTAISGTTSATTGSYPLNVFGRACVHGTIITVPFDSCVAGSLASLYSYSLSVCAQTSTGVCTPDTSHFSAGSNIYPSTLPCITPGTPYSGQVSIRVPDSIDASLLYAGLPANTYYVYIDSIRLDSITGAPAGISAETYPGDSVWLHGGQFACGLFTGTTTVSSGNFPIGVYGRGCIHGTFPIIGYIDTCIDKNIGAFFNFSLNVCSGPACTVNTSGFSPGVYVSPSSLPCMVTGEAFTGQVNIQVPSSLDASYFYPQLPSNTFTVTIDSIQINSITGYPGGVSSVSNPILTSWLQANAYACAFFSGTPTGPAGSYPLTISGIGCGSTTLPLIGTIDTCMAVTFSQEFPLVLNVCYPAGVIELFDGMGLNIYPNPNQGNFTVTVSSDAHITGTLSVMDQLGRVIHNQSLDVNGTTQIPLDLGEVAPGAYILMINAGGKRSVKQFIVK